MSKAEDYEKKWGLSDAQLKGVNTSYVYNPSSGLYESQSLAPQNQRNSRNSPLHISTRRDWWATGIAIVGTAISLVTLILLWFTVHYARAQWITMNVTLRQVQKQTTAAETSAKQSVKATTNAAKFFQAEQRAWLFINSTGFEISSGLPTGVLGIKNTGHTPAFNVAMRLCSEVSNTAPTDEKSFGQSYCRTQRGGILGPGGVMLVALSDFQHPMTAEEMKSFVKGNSRLYFWLDISYGIIGSPMTVHHTIACMRSELSSDDPNRDKIANNAVRNQLGPCSKAPQYAN